MTTKDERKCEFYPDLAPERKEEGASAAEKERLTASNHQRQQFFLALRRILTERFGLAGPIPFFRLSREANDILAGVDQDQRAYFLGVAGLMLLDGYSDPLLGKPDTALGPDDVIFTENGVTVRIARRFVEATVKAVQEFNAAAALFKKIYQILREEGDQGDEFVVFARQIAEVGRRLGEERASANDPQLRRRVLNTLSAALNAAVGGRASAIDVDLPDLEEGTESDIIADNVRATAAIMFSASLEDLKYFTVADKVAEMFVSGMLPISRGTGGELLYRYVRTVQDRLTEVERRSMYARTLGVAQGSVEEPLANREFSDLWIRFLSAVSYFQRDIESTNRKKVLSETVFKAGRDLAVNLSLHGYGMAHFAAVELQATIRDISAIFSTPDVLAAFGARDRWQLVERVSAMSLGGSVNSVRQRTMAQSGSRIILWLADNAATLVSPSGELPIKQIAPEVERYLAVTGTPDQTIERFSEPLALQNQRTIPDFIGSGALGDAIRGVINAAGGTGGAN